MATHLQDSRLELAGSPPVRIAPCPKRVRVLLGGATIADSRRVVYLFERDHVPVYYFPREDVLRFLAERGHNFIRLWRWEQVRSQAAGGAFHLCMTPQPWAIRRRVVQRERARERTGR